MYGNSVRVHINHLFDAFQKFVKDSSYLVHPHKLISTIKVWEVQKLQDKRALGPNPSTQCPKGVSWDIKNRFEPIDLEVIICSKLNLSGFSIYAHFNNSSAYVNEGCKMPQAIKSA